MGVGEEKEGVVAGLFSRAALFYHLHRDALFDEEGWKMACVCALASISHRSLGARSLSLRRFTTNLDSLFSLDERFTSSACL